MRRIKTGLAVLALLLCMAPPSPASDYHHVRLTYMKSDTGEALSGGSLYVYAPGTTDTIAAVYSDTTGTQAGQPLESDDGGNVSVYLPRGIYDIYFAHSAWSITDTWEDYEVGLLGTGPVKATRLSIAPLSPSLPDSATLAAFGDGAFWFSATCQSLCVYREDSDSIYIWRLPDERISTP